MACIVIMHARPNMNLSTWEDAENIRVPSPACQIYFHAARSARSEKSIAEGFESFIEEGSDWSSPLDPIFLSSVNDRINRRPKSFGIIPISQIFGLYRA